MSEKIRILMVEDHKLLRMGLKSILEKYPNMLVVGEAETGRIAIEEARRLKPDVILMDIGLPDISGIDATKKIKEFLPNTKVIMLTSHSDKREVIDSILAGANGYMLKNIKSEHMITIIQTIKEGAIWLDPSIAYVIKDKSLFVTPKSTSRSDFKADHANLTEREYEVLKLIVDGRSNADIANELKISEHTAKAHVCNIIQKLVVDDRTQAAVKAIKEGLV